MSFCAKGVFAGDLDINSTIGQTVVVFSVFELLFGGYFCGIILLPVEKHRKI